MNQQELFSELKSMLPRFTQLIQKVDLIDTRTQNIEGGLVGNEFNNHYGLLKQFKEFKEDFEEYKKDTDDRLKVVEHHKTGMNWGVGIIAFIATSTIVIKFTGGIKWIWESIWK